VSEFERIHNLPVKPHSWKDCYPVIGDRLTGRIDRSDEKNRAVRRIFNKLDQLDRIKFHQACCQSRDSPAHDAVVKKIVDQLQATGVLDDEPERP
jgi:hypothetical protein